MFYVNFILKKAGSAVHNKEQKCFTPDLQVNSDISAIIYQHELY